MCNEQAEQPAAYCGCGADSRGKRKRKTPARGKLIVKHTSCIEKKG